MSKGIRIETERGEDFLNKYGSKKSRQMNKSRLKKYLSFRDMDCKELIQEIDEDRKGEKIDREYIVEKKINKFLEHLEEEGDYSDNYRAAILGTLRAFYKFHGFPLHSERLKDVSNKSKKKNKAISLDREKVAQLYNATSSKRNKALILFLFQSGQAAGQISELNYGDIADELKEGKIPLMIDYSGRKGNANDYCTFLGADGVHAIEKYLDERKEKLENRRRELKNEEPDDLEKALEKINSVITEKDNLRYEAPLFAKRDGIRRLSAGAISETLKYLAKNTDVVSDEKLEYADINPIRPNAFRHNFKTRLTPYVSSFIIEYMMGHDLGVEGEYYIGEIGSKEDLREYYAKNIEEHLSIQTTSTEKEAYVSEEFADMKGDRIKEIVGEDYYSKEEVEGIREGLRKEKENLRKELMKEVKEQEETIDSQKENIKELKDKLDTFRDVIVDDLVRDIDTLVTVRLQEILPVKLNETLSERISWYDSEDEWICNYRKPEAPEEEEHYEPDLNELAELELMKLKELRDEIREIVKT